MNPDEPLVSVQDEAQAAIASVLGAEREASAAIGRCREEARDIAARAEANVRAVAERADRRLSRLKGRLRGGLSRALAALDAQGRGEAAPAEADPERLDRAVAKLARELTAGRE
jgi:hypothetical protein